MTAKPAFVAFLLAIAVSTLSAQDTTKPKPDSARAGMMDDHMMGPWKEMNDFHRVMAATWHPASQKSDMTPLKSRAKDLVTTAESWAASTPPAIPASCASEPVRNATSNVVTETKALLALVDSGADDAKLKAALKTVHDAFEAAEKGCAGHGGHEGAR
jgi:hypothetical protein